MSVLINSYVLGNVVAVTGQILLEGDEQSGVDVILLEGDAQTGTDALLYEELA